MVNVSTIINSNLLEECFGAYLEFPPGGSTVYAIIMFLKEK